MVQLIVGKKGKGKTKCLLDKVNTEVKNVLGSIAFLDKNTKHMYELNNKIRLIVVSDFMISNADEFIGFVSGVEFYSYGRSVLVALIYSIFFISTSSISSKTSAEQLQNNLETNPDFVYIFMATMAVLSALICIMTILDIFLLNPLEVGCMRFFLKNQDVEGDFGELGFAYKNNYLNSVLALFLRSIIVSIFFFLLVIPGWILTYSYRMVPFILADDPNVSAIDALKRSRAMMKGHKWNAFVYDLSFIGWFFLSFITLGIVGIFYVNPYKHNADAALYQAIRG